MRRIVFAVAALLMGSVACGTDVSGPGDQAAPPTDSAPKAEEVLVQARAAMAEVQSYQFVFEVAGERPPHNIFPPLERTGAWATPDNWLLTVDGEDTVLVIGEDVYFRIPQGGLDGPWRGVGNADFYPGFVPHGPFLHLTAPELLDHETVDGEPAYRIAGQNEPDDPEVRFGVIMQVELFIRQSDHLPVRMVIKDFSRSVAPGPDGTPVPIPPRPQDSATFYYHSFNVPVTVEAPGEWETGPLPTATPGYAFQATLGFKPEAADLTDAEWHQLATAVAEFLRDTDVVAEVRLVDGMVMVDVPYPREQATTLAASILAAPLPFLLTLTAEAYSTRG